MIEGGTEFEGLRRRIELAVIGRDGETAAYVRRPIVDEGDFAVGQLGGGKGVGLDAIDRDGAMGGGAA